MLIKKLRYICLACVITVGLIAITDSNGRGAEDGARSTPNESATDLVCEEDKFCVTVYNPDKAYQGTTFFVYKYSNPDIIYEVDMKGNVVWNFELSENLGSDQTEAELLPGNTILLVSPKIGLHEIDREGNVLWSYEDRKVSHDADRLPNGNTIYVYGMNDQKTDAVVKEITPEGKLVWQWYAGDHFNYPPYSEIDPEEQGGWAHTNAVTRLYNGNTLISIRNFDMIVEVNPDGTVLNTIKDIVKSPHDPLVLENGHILVAHQTQTYHAAVELDTETEEIVWEFGFDERKDFPIRDVNLLPNGNILITGARRLVEVTRDKEIVWQLELVVPYFSPGESPSLGFYKAERFSSPVADIKANGSNAALSVSPGTPVSITVSLNPRSYGSQNADWWVVELTPSSTFNHFDLGTCLMVQGLLPTHQGPLFSLGTTQLLNSSDLTVGTHTFYFGVDLNMNGSLNINSTYYDSVGINVTRP